MCIDNGDEFHHDFAVTVRLNGKGLAGANVEILNDSSDAPIAELQPTPFSGRTSSDGSLRVRGLPPGNYWLRADVLGTFVTSQCFHVLAQPTVRAKRRLTYEWGNYARSTSRVAGRLIDSQSSAGGAPIENLLRRINEPIRGATLKLQDPRTGEVFSATSDEEGRFTFDVVPDATYVLRVDGGRSNRDFGGADLVLRVKTSEAARKLLIKYADPGGGSCGGTELGFDVPI
jgi:hypothetical protein